MKKHHGPAERSNKHYIGKVNKKSTELNAPLKPELKRQKPGHSTILYFTQTKTSI